MKIFLGIEYESITIFQDTFHFLEGVFLSISLTQPNPLQKMVSLSNET